MNTSAFQSAIGGDRWEKTVAWYDKVAEEQKAMNEQQRATFHACLMAFLFARAFYVDSKTMRDCNMTGDGLLMALASSATSFHAVFLRIGEDIIGKRCHEAQAESLKRLEACHAWMKSKGINGWRVMRYVQRNSKPLQFGWEEVAPREFVSNILDAYREGQRVIAKCRSTKPENRVDKYDPELNNNNEE